MGVSRGSFSDGLVAEVYIANGYNFPAVPTAGPAADIQRDAVLLVEQSSIPASAAVELTRLGPRRIFVAGDTASVSLAVCAQLNR